MYHNVQWRVISAGDELNKDAPLFVSYQDAKLHFTLHTATLCYYEISSIVL